MSYVSLKKSLNNRQAAVLEVHVETRFAVSLSKLAAVLTCMTSKERLPPLSENRGGRMVLECSCRPGSRALSDPNSRKGEIARE